MTTSFIFQLPENIYYSSAFQITWPFIRNIAISWFREQGRYFQGKDINLKIHEKSLQVVP